MPLADSVLRALLDRAEGAAVRRSTRAVQEGFASQDSPYWKLSLDERDAFHHRMREAAACGGVSLVWAKQGGEDRPLTTVRVEDRRALALFLGVDSLEGRVARACTQLEPWSDLLRVQEILAAWESRKAVRGLEPEAAGDIADALRVLDAAREEEDDDLIARPLSVRLFGDSKRIEALRVPLDLLTADSTGAPARHWEEVFSRLGIKKEPQPFLVAGTGHLQLAQGDACPIVVPYVGVANCAVTGYIGSPAWVMTIENLTTFHQASQLLNGQRALLVYTGGMPSPSWVTAYLHILGALPKDVQLYHWGDIDVGGFRIAARIRTTCVGDRPFSPWLMDARGVSTEMRASVNEATRNAMARAASSAGWDDLSEAMIPEAVEQEGIRVALPPV
ncbi:Wadjet anti-phage system protein JetD domain-containing protein [Dyella amyloliquefaciens]|uniref:Wadjet anti-phage system protein JetD domain-containing protein n=1 Tax=Dyella amyloliquefaciens TaxID=1770545 RepID=UPI00102E2C7A|nr:Wadjet anti-phage system protein JetD domain-containing protein [Dyella amyloliquefaciens]